MSTLVTWPSGTDTAVPANYNIPEAGDLNWGSLTEFLTTLAGNAQSTSGQRMAVSVVTSTPITLNENACIIITDMSTPSAVAITMPEQTSKQIVFIKDGAGDAATNNITLTPRLGDTIDGQANLVLNQDNQFVMLVAETSSTNWRTVIKGSY